MEPMKCLFALCSFLLYEIGLADEPLGPVRCILYPLPLPAETTIILAGQMNFSGMEREFNDGTLRVAVIDTKPEFETVIQFVSNFFHSSRAGSGCSEVVAVVGDIDFKTASILHTLASRSNFTLTLVAAVAPSTFLPVTNLVLPNLLDIHPLSHYIEAIVSFINEWKWSRIGLIRDDTLYYQYAAEMLYTKLAEASKTITPNFMVKGSISHILNEVREYGTYIFVLCMRTETALLLLEGVHKLDYTWPKYAWIAFSIENDPDTFTGALEGTFLTQDYSRIGLNDFLNLNNTGRFLFNKSVIADDILLEFREGKRLHNVSVLQLAKSSESELVLEIAYYDPKMKHLNVIHNLSELSSIPHGSTVILEFQDSTAGSAIALTIFTSIFTFVTVVFAFYIYFREEPEIKATSVSVSLCMFLGCYLMLLFVPLLLVELQPDGYLGLNGNFICNVLLTLSGIGVPSVLILASLFVKMVRVYVIFVNPLSYRKKLFSNAFLFLYISLILLPTVLIVVFWMSLDTFRNARLRIPQKGHELLLERCESEHTVIWVSLLFLYIVTVIAALAILAFKSSEIRYKNFRDTKATNAFTFLTVFTLMSGVAFWLFLQNFEDSYSGIINSSIPLYFTHFTLPLLCQVFLFVPKVYPPIIRHLTKNAVKSKGKARSVHRIYVSN